MSFSLNIMLVTRLCCVARHENSSLSFLTHAVCVCLQSAGLDAENLRRVLDQITALHTDSTSRDSGHPPSEPSRQLSPLKALTEQLKKGSIGKQTRTSTTSSSLEADSSFTFSPELTGRVDLVLKELQSLNRKLNSNLQLLQLYVTFLRAAQQVRVSLGQRGTDTALGQCEMMVIQFHAAALSCKELTASGRCCLQE